MQGGERYNSISSFLIDYFGKKTIKVSLDAGFTCPNRDGSLGIGGCGFCSSDGSGELASHINIDDLGMLKTSVANSISNQIETLSEKWPDAKYIGYLQSHTNTYSDIDTLRSLYDAVLNDPRIDGLAIATRPDCLGIRQNGESEILDLIEELKKDHLIWVELGLQSSNDDTLLRLNTCYNSMDYIRASNALNKKNILYVTHVILGLPGETREDMVNTVNFVCKKCRKPFGIKLHLMNLVKDSPLAKEHKASDPAHTGTYSPYFKEIDEYADLVVDLLELIPSDITIHRLTGDVPRKMLISPEWSYKKRSILNSINRKLKERNTYQGRLC